MSPEFHIGGKKVPVNIYYIEGSVIIYPRVCLTETLAKDLQTALGGRGYVDSGFATYTGITVYERKGRSIDLGEVLDKIEACLRANDIWFIPRI